MIQAGKASTIRTLVILRPAFFAGLRISALAGGAESAGTCTGPSSGVLGFTEDSASSG